MIRLRGAHVLTAALAALTLTLGGCRLFVHATDDEVDAAEVMFYHLAASQGSGDDSELLFGIADQGEADTFLLRSILYGDREGYDTVYAGEREVRVFLPSVSVESAAGQATLEADRFYAAFAFSRDNQIDPAILVTAVPTDQQIGGAMQVQFLNLVANSEVGALTFERDVGGAPDTIATVAPRSSSGYVELTPFTGRFVALDSLGAELARTGEVVLGAGTSYTVVVFGGDDSAAVLPDGFPPIEMRVFVDR